MTRVIILAAGLAERWSKYDLPEPKQLYKLEDGRTILRRMLDQLDKRKCAYAIITNNDPIILNFKHCSHKPSKCKCTCDTLLSSKAIWADKTIVLLGDTLYSDYALDQLFEKDNIFIGNQEELFGFTFTKDNFGKIVVALEKAIAGDNFRRNEDIYDKMMTLEVNYKNIVKGTGRLWDMYCYLHGKPRKERRKDFIYIDDYTIDFDDYRDIKKYKENLKKFNF